LPKNFLYRPGFVMNPGFLFCASAFISQPDNEFAGIFSKSLSLMHSGL